MRKKLIEVALPLEAINKASAKEKSNPHGNPSSLHRYWARRPLAAARAVLFSSIVDDPDQEGLPHAYLAAVDALPKPLNRPDWRALGAHERRRLKLFGFIEELVQWENSNNTQVLRTAKELIDAATDGNPPPVWDPFAGGGTIPLEAQRLGLESRGSDLNPLAVIISKALIELPGEVAGQPPTHPESENMRLSAWKGAQGLAEDVRWWGEWLRNEAEKKIGHLYPPVRVTSDMASERPDLRKYVGKDLTVIAWLWTRTVKCPNPACLIQMPLLRTMQVCGRKNNEAWVVPSGLWTDSQGKHHVRFVVRSKKSHPHEQPRTDGTVKRSGASCIHCGEAVPFPYIRDEAKSGKMGEDLMCTVAEGDRQRVYVGSTPRQVHSAIEAIPKWTPTGRLPEKALGFRVQQYGMTEWKHLFTNRQLTALTSLVDVLRTNIELAPRIKTYLLFGVTRMADFYNNICSWNNGRETIRNLFARQAVPMSWDFVEANPFSNSAGNYLSQINWITKAIVNLPAGQDGQVTQANAELPIEFSGIVSTDPPYYDNIGYADISDFFYVWLREGLKNQYPNLFATLLTPKSEELIATPYRHGGSKERAAAFFENGLARVWQNVSSVQQPEYPVTIYYAYKQTETGLDGDLRFTGWDTMLQAIVDAGFAITATWPIRSEKPGRAISIGTNALASSIVLSCRMREGQSSTTRAALIEELRSSLPAALGALQTSTLPPVDLAQASVGPAMAIFSQYDEVLDVAGNKMTVAQVLPLILEQLAEALNELPDLDSESRFALRWYDSHGWGAGPYGQAETMATAMALAVESIEKAGIAKSTGGSVQLIKAESLPLEYDPADDDRFTLWEVVHYLGRALSKGGEAAAAQLLADMQVSHPTLRTDAAKELCNALFSVADRNGRNDDAQFYNELGQLWTSVVVASASIDTTSSSEPDLFNQE
jgi:putative DNA methylase